MHAFLCIVKIEEVKDLLEEKSLIKSCFKNSINKIYSEKLEEKVGEDIVEEIDGNLESLEDVVRKTKCKPPATEDIAL